MSNYSPEELDLYGTSSSYKTRLEAIVLLEKALSTQPKELIINSHSLNIIHSLLKDINVFVISDVLELITKHAIPVNLLYLKTAVKNSRLKLFVFSYFDLLKEKSNQLRALNEIQSLVKTFNDPNPNCKVFLMRIFRCLFGCEDGEINDLIVKFCSDRNPEVRAEAKALINGDTPANKEVLYISPINKIKDTEKQSPKSPSNTQQAVKINEQSIQKIFAEPESPQTFKTHHTNTQHPLNNGNFSPPVLPSHLKLSVSQLSLEWKVRLELLKTLTKDIPLSTYTINDLRYSVDEIEFAPFIFQFHTGNINILKYILSIQIHPNSIYSVMEYCLSNQFRKELVDYFIKFSCANHVRSFKEMFGCVLQKGDVKGMRLRCLCSVLVEVKSMGHLLDWVIEGEFIGNDKREVNTVNSLCPSSENVDSFATPSVYEMGISPSTHISAVVNSSIPSVTENIQYMDLERDEQHNMNCSVYKSSVFNATVSSKPYSQDLGSNTSSEKDPEDINNSVKDTTDKLLDIKYTGDLKEDKINTLLKYINPQISEIKKEIENLKLNNEIYENTNIIDYFLNTRTFVDLKDVFPVSKQIKYLSEIITPENETNIYNYLNEMFKSTFYRKLPENLKGFENAIRKYENPLTCINNEAVEDPLINQVVDLNIKGDDILENSLTNLSIRIEEPRNNSTPISKKSRLLKIQPKYSLNILLEKMQTPSNTTNQFIYTLEINKLKIIANSLILYFSLEIERLHNLINSEKGEDRLINLNFLDEIIDFLKKILFEPPFLSKLKSSTISRVLLSLIDDEQYFKKVVLEFKDNIECDLLIEVYSLCYVKSQSSLFIDLLEALEINKYNSLRVSSIISKFVRVIDNEKLLVCLSKIFKRCYGEGEVVNCKYLDKLIHY